MLPSPNLTFSHCEMVAFCFAESRVEIDNRIKNVGFVPLLSLKTVAC